MRELRDFERRARDAGIAMELLRPAHFALCASIDDVVLNTPWGAASDWASRSAGATFHHGARGTGSVLRLCCSRCEGRRQVPAGDRTDVSVRLARLHRTISSVAGRRRSSTGCVTKPTPSSLPSEEPVDPDLSRRWRVIAAPYRSSRGRLPVWVVAAAAVAVCGGLFFWASTALNAGVGRSACRGPGCTARPYASGHRAAIVQPLPPPPAPAEPGIVDGLRGN